MLKIALFHRHWELFCQPVVWRNVFIILLSTCGGCSTLLFYPVLMCFLWVMFKVKMLRSIHFIKFWGWDGFGSAEDFSEMLSAQLFRCSTAINSIYWFLPPLVFGAFKIILDFPCKMLFGKWQFGIATAEAVATSWCSFPALFFVLLYAFFTF